MVHTLIHFANDATFILDLVDLLLTVKSRWKYLRILAPIPNIELALLLNAEPTDLTFLNSFSIRGDIFWMGVYRGERNPTCDIVNTPHLRHIRIQSLQKYVEPLPCHYLTTLSISLENPDACICHLPIILTQCHNLVELTLLINGSIASVVPPPSFPRLRRLELDPNREGLKLFPSSYMPELKHLKLRLDNITRENPIVIQRFFGILPPLETFLTLPRDGMGEIVEVLRSQAELIELTLESMHNTQTAKAKKELILNLTIGAQIDSVILPRLELFTHINTNVRDIYYKPFLLSRTSASNVRNTVIGNSRIATLKRAHIISVRSKVVDLIDDPEVSAACVASGLDLKVHYPTHRIQFRASLGISKEDERPPPLVIGRLGLEMPDEDTKTGSDDDLDM
ncbi:hypothetical protein AX16_009203 [Volvariella volvacea WC 439]|nr:hypothetical protein AX16_009203 [Volvariella volvacea WC 439]